MIESRLTPTAASNCRNLMRFSSQFLPSRGQGTGSSSPSKDSSLREAQQGRRALVVDDISDVTEMLSMLMTHAGYDVSTASSDHDAIAIAREGRVAAITSAIGT